MPKRKLSSIQERDMPPLPTLRTALAASHQHRGLRTQCRGFQSQTRRRTALGFIPGQWEPIYLPQVSSCTRPVPLATMIMRLAQLPLLAFKAFGQATVQLYRERIQGRRVRVEPVNRPDGARKRRFIDDGPIADGTQYAHDVLFMPPRELEFEGDRPYTPVLEDSPEMELESRELWEKCAFRPLYPNLQVAEEDYMSEGSSDESSDNESYDVDMEDSSDSDESDLTVDTTAPAPTTNVEIGTAILATRYLATGTPAEHANEPVIELSPERATERGVETTTEPPTQVPTDVTIDAPNRIGDASAIRPMRDSAPVHPTMTPRVSRVNPPSTGDVTFTPTPFSPFSEGMSTPPETSTPRHISTPAQPKRVMELSNNKLSPIGHASPQPSPLRTVSSPVPKGKSAEFLNQVEKTTVRAAIKNAAYQARHDAQATTQETVGQGVTDDAVNPPQIYPTMWTEDMSTLSDAPPLKETRLANQAHIRTFYRDGLVGEKEDSFLEDVNFSPTKELDVSSLSIEGDEEQHGKVPPSVAEELRRPPEPLLPELSIEQLKCLVQASAKTNGGRLHMDLARGINTHDLKTLLPHEFNGDPIAWLNDNIVNEYLTLLVDSLKKKAGYIHKAGGPAPPVHAFASQWYVNASKDIKSVRRWASRKNFGGKNLLDMEVLLIPICKGNHWRLLAIRPKERLVEYLDSLPCRKSQVDEFILLAEDWLRQELGADFVESDWQYVPEQRSLQQQNASDCGVFTCLNALALLRKEDPGLVKVTDGMHEARRHIAASLLSGHVNGEL